MAPGWNPPAAETKGDTYLHEGQTYYFDGSNWVTEAEWEMEDKLSKDDTYG